MSMTSVKEAAKRLIEKLPDVTWDDLMREIYVRLSVERGLADGNAGEVIDVADVRARFQLPAGR